MKDHLACVPNKDINICENVPADVRAGLEVWRRQRFGISVHEGGGSHDVQEDVSVCEVSQIGASKRSASASVTGPSAKRTPLPPRKGSLESASIQAGFQKQVMHDATREITRLFIRCAIPFNVANTQQWKRAMRTVSRIGSEWEGPSGETIRRRELRKEQASLEIQMEPFKETWVKYGCTILYDGKTDARKRNVYNVLVSSCKGTMFIKAIDASTSGLTITG